MTSTVTTEPAAAPDTEIVSVARPAVSVVARYWVVREPASTVARTALPGWFDVIVSTGRDPEVGGLTAAVHVATTVVVGTVPFGAVVAGAVVGGVVPFGAVVAGAVVAGGALVVVGDGVGTAGSRVVETGATVVGTGSSAATAATGEVVGTTDVAEIVVVEAVVVEPVVVEPVVVEPGTRVRSAGRVARTPAT